MSNLFKNPFFKFLRPEDHLHMQLCNYVKMQYPGVAIHHSPNEGRRTPFERFLLKVLGVSPGFPDLLLIYRHRLIVLELKWGKNKPTKNQEFWLKTFSESHVPADWFNNFEDAKHFIDHYFLPLKQQALNEKIQS